MSNHEVLPVASPIRAFSSKEDFILFIRNKIGQSPFQYAFDKSRKVGHSFNSNDLSLMFTHGKEDFVKSSSREVQLAERRIQDFVSEMSEGGFIGNVYLSYKGGNDSYYHLNVKNPVVKRGINGVMEIIFVDEPTAVKLRSCGFSPVSTGDVYTVHTSPLLIGGIGLRYKED